VIAHGSFVLVFIRPLNTAAISGTILDAVPLRY
jgi:hypothetical protein